MSSHWQAASLLARGRFGEEASIEVEAVNDRLIVSVLASGSVVALAGGTDPEAVWRRLLLALTREDPALRTPEVAGVLGINPSSVARAMRQGRLRPLAVGEAARAHTFSPAEVHRYLRLGYRRGRPGKQGAGERT